MIDVMWAADMAVLRKVEGGFCHSFPASELTAREARLARVLEAGGYLKRLRKRGRFPTRYVVTTAGSWALGTFDFTDQEFVTNRRAYGWAA